MKSSLFSAFLATFTLTYGAVLPRDGPNGPAIRPDRPISAPGATRHTARYGPFKLPSNKVNGPLGQAGMTMENLNNIDVPCTGCTYTFIKGDMVYRNGTSANTNNGAYMHHITLVAGPREGGNLLQMASGVASGGIAADGKQPAYKPFYLIGNERLSVTYPKAGVYLAKQKGIMLTVQLENLVDDQKEVFIDMDYDYIPGQPEGYVDIVPVAQDALGLMAIFQANNQVGRWERTSSAYTVGQDARVLMMYGHVHDGGIHTEILVNGKVQCDSLAYYNDMKVPDGSSMQMQGPAESGGHGHSGKRDVTPTNAHIVNFGECKEAGMVKKGDKITTKVYYDFEKRPSTPLANGKGDPLMGISMTYLGVPVIKE